MTVEELMKKLAEIDSNVPVVIPVDAREAVDVDDVTVSIVDGKTVAELTPGMPLTTDAHIDEIAVKFFEQYAKENGYSKTPDASTDADSVSLKLNEKGHVMWDEPSDYDWADFNEDFFLAGGFDRSTFDDAVRKNPHWLHCARENGWDDTEVRDGFSEILKEILGVDSLEDYVISRQLN